MPRGRPGTARVFLHVGSPKTGTTFLQNVLWKQRELAREQGLLLPGERFNDHFRATLDVRGLASRPPHPPRAVGMWSRLVEESVNWSGPALISHELFAGATPEQAQAAMAQLADRAEVHVVVTARDLVRQITAEWQEHVKHRSTMTLPGFVADIRGDEGKQRWFWRVQDFADVAQRWGAALPASQVHVVTVPPPGSPPDLLWERFAGLLGLAPETFDTAIARSNTSLGLEQTELLRRVNAALGDRLPVPGPYPAVVKEILAHKLLARRPGTRLTLAEADVEYAVERSRDIAARLDASGVDVIGDLAELTELPGSPEAPAGVDGYPTPSADDLLDESVAALADLLVELSPRRAARERLAFAERSPVRFALARASERHALLMKARNAYRRRLRRSAAR